MSNKRDLREAVEENLVTEFEVWQDRPNTAVHVMAEFRGVVYERYGWAKVQYPDEWDAEYGIQLAKDKAIAKVTKAIVNSSLWTHPLVLDRPDLR